MQILNRITVEHKTVTRTVGPLFLSIGGYAICDNHYQAFVTDNGYELASDCWCCLNSRDLKFTSVSFMCNEIITKKGIFAKKNFGTESFEKKLEKNIFLKHFKKGSKKNFVKKFWKKEF